MGWQSFTNLGQQMNILYLTEQKGRSLGFQALNDTHFEIFWSMEFIGVYKTTVYTIIPFKSLLRISFKCPL